jgi:3'-phosphoadenosine 5'-phosphosulfate sulfotransferase (PAPS reductase)/FAD synthetase
MPPIEVSPDVLASLAANAVVAISVSGGKDSDAAAIATHRYLESIGYKGPRILVHAELGMVEWKDSLPACQRLANFLGYPLHVVRRIGGGLMERWESRWVSSVRRYENLECVTLIPPWSTPSMRFCTSEQKTHPIAGLLKRLFPGQVILNVTGVRCEESFRRSLTPVSSVNGMLDGKRKIRAFTWNPVRKWTVKDVWDLHQAEGFAGHEAYRVYGTSRVSCVMCIMGSKDDLRKAASCADNHEVYRRMVGLEVASAFSFQSGSWLGDAAPHLLDGSAQEALATAKRTALARVEAERLIPPQLRFEKGWPLRQPTMEECEVLAGVRRTVSGLNGLSARYLDADGIFNRYAELMQVKASKLGAVKN